MGRGADLPVAQLSASDQAQFDRALALAAQAIGLSDPNPRVGCVLHDALGRFAGEGHTREAGGPHAEIVALRDAAARGVSLAGGTAWVSLEPCAHHGRTPPCADALIAAKLARVVVAAIDPFDRVAGEGIARLRAAGIAVDLAPPDSAVARAARELNIGFFSRVLRHRPWVRLKVAASLDGRTALADGRSQWITGVEARTDGHRWRRRAGALLTGAGTVRLDDPRLDVRLVPTAVQPMRVVVASRLDVAPSARVLQPPGRALVVGASADDDAAQRLRDAGIDTLILSDPHGRVDLAALLESLAADGVNELHVEAGAALNGALLGTGLVDELLVYFAPRLIGPGREIATLPPLARLDDSLALRFVETTALGDDLRIRARVAGHDDFLG
jgi:diaminohydroxyphosphoribosylaminopyrimidine deaminase/5-amino-6-(5-phosphoribosylamino)uracil reductase